MTDETPPEEQQPAPVLPPASVDTSSLLRAYAFTAIALSLATGIVQVLGGFGMLASIGCAIWAYRLRRREDAHGLFSSHGTWLVRTFWLTSALTLVAIVLAGWVIGANGDGSMVEAIQPALQNHTATPEQVEAAIRRFTEVNAGLLRYATLVCFMPVVLYVLARCIRGYRLAYDGKPLENAKSWLV